MAQTQDNLNRTQSLNNRLNNRISQLDSQIVELKSQINALEQEKAQLLELEENKNAPKNNNGNMANKRMLKELSSKIIGKEI